MKLHYQNLDFTGEAWVREVHRTATSAMLRADLLMGPSDKARPVKSRLKEHQDDHHKIR